MHGQKNIKSYHVHVPTALKSGSLDLMGASGPLQACNGMALIFYFTYCIGYEVCFLFICAPSFELSVALIFGQ